MDFETYLINILNKEPSTAADYNRRVNKVVEKDFKLSLSTITIQEIDAIIAAIRYNTNYCYSHGNPYVPALKKYKEYINYLSSLHIKQCLPFENVVPPVQSQPKPLHIKQCLPFGNNQDSRYVYYDKNILPDEKVVELSEHLESEYGAILEFISFILRNDDNDLNFDYKKIKIVLKKEQPKDTYITSDNTIKQILKNKLKQNSLSEIDIDKIFSKKNIVVPRAGEYCHDGDDYHINLYYKNISCDNYEEFLIKIYSTLAHELMHYVHNLIVGDKIFYEKGLVCGYLKEAVADFVSFIYLFYKTQYNFSQYDSIVAKNKYNFWVDHFEYNYPYAKALYFINKYHDKFDDYIADGCKLKLQQVVRKSKISLLDGYKLLEKL